MTKLIVSLVAVFLTTTAWTNPQCIQIYSADFVPVDGEVTISVATILGAKGPYLSRVVDLFSDKTIEGTYFERRYRETAVKEIIEDKTFDKEKFASVYKRLAESNFILSPIHELLYTLAQSLKAVPYTGNGYYTGENNTSYQITKTQFEAPKKSIEGSLEIDFKNRVNTAGKMLEKIHSDYSGLLDIRGWPRLNSSERFVIAGNIAERTTSAVKKEDIVAILDTLSEIASESDGSLYLKKVFELTLPEIHDVAAARARGFSTQALKTASPFLIGATAGLFGVGGLFGHTPIEMIQFIPHGPMPIAFLVGGGLAGTFGLPKLKPFRNILEVPGRVSSFASRTRKKFGLKSRILKRAETEVETSKIAAERAAVARQLESNSKLAISKDEDFNAIKQELKDKKLSELIDIGRWGSSFKRANTNLSERMTLFGEKMNLLQSDLKAAREIEDSTAELERPQRDIARAKLDSTYEKLALALTELNALKYDTLSMAVALDRYKDLLNQAKANQQTQPGAARIFTGTESIFSLMEQTLISLASLTTTFDSRLFDDLNLVSSIRASIDADVVIRQIQKNKPVSDGKQ